MYTLVKQHKNIMSKKLVDALTTAFKKVDAGALISSTKKLDTSSLLKKIELPKFQKLDVSNAAKKADVASAAKKTDLADGLKKLESDSLTKKFGDTVKKSNFYKKNQKKLLALGITVAGAAGWYGTLLAQGHSPSEAFAIMEETFKNAAEGVAEVGGDVAGKALKAAFEAAWLTAVVFIHNLVGKYVFGDTGGTALALKSLITLLVIVKFFSLFGINIFGLIFGMFSSRKS